MTPSLNLLLICLKLIYDLCKINTTVALEEYGFIQIINWKIFYSFTCHLASPVNSPCACCATALKVRKACK